MAVRPSGHTLATRILGIITLARRSRRCRTFFGSGASCSAPVLQEARLDSAQGCISGCGSC